MIKTAEDPLISCYNCDRYNRDLDHLQCEALGWFVQFAIRSDLETARTKNANSDYCEGFPEEYCNVLCSKFDEVYELIREKGVIDESDLAKIGLTLYDFPTLGHFFVTERRFVREATVRELIQSTGETIDIVRNSGLTPCIPQGANPVESIAILINQMTRSQVETEASVPPGEMSKQRFFFVDMTAPVAILKSQFLAAVERSAKQKSAIDVLFATWREFGILPYLDLMEWCHRQSQQVKSAAQADLLFPVEARVRAKRNKYYQHKKRKVRESTSEAKTILETTRPNAVKMLDVNSQPFRTLLSKASEEFQEAIEFAREPDEKSPRAKAAAEAFSRWFPKTYPMDLVLFNWLIEIAPPKQALLIALFTEEMKQDGHLKLSIPERIREHMKYPTNLVGVMKILTERPAGAHSSAFSAPPEDQDEADYQDAMRGFRERYLETDIKGNEIAAQILSTGFEDDDTPM